jgi:hypothetical protein
METLIMRKCHVKEWEKNFPERNFVLEENKYQSGRRRRRS